MVKVNPKINCLLDFRLLIVIISNVFGLRSNLTKHYDIYLDNKDIRFVVICEPIITQTYYTEM